MPARAVRAALLCLGLLGLLDLLVIHERGATGDEPFYLAMARHPLGSHTFPYAYRIAIPWLVHLLPVSTIAGFTILGLLASGIAAGGLYALLEECDVPARLALGLTVGFALSPTLWVVVVRHFQSIDPASVMVMVLGVLFMVRRQRLALAVVLSFGAAVRESTMFLVPVTYLIWARRPLDIGAARDTLLTCALPVLIYIGLRTQIPAVDRQDVPGYSGSLLGARIDLLRAAPWGAELRRLAYTYGPLWIIAPLALRDCALVRRAGLIVVLCIVSMTFAYDWDRVIFLAAPVFYVAAGHVLRDRRRWALAVIIALLCVDVGYGVYLQVAGVRHGIDTTRGTVPVV